MKLIQSDIGKIFGQDTCDYVIMSAIDGIHMEVSLYYSAEAIDLMTPGLTDKQVAKLVTDLRQNPRP
jgi:hypothetical protein